MNNNLNQNSQGPSNMIPGSIINNSNNNQQPVSNEAPKPMDFHHMYTNNLNPIDLNKNVNKPEFKQVLDSKPKGYIRIIIFLIIVLIFIVGCIYLWIIFK